jgi:molecular chaperone DnaK
MQIFLTEIQLKEYGDTLPTEKKVVIEGALEELKLVYRAQSFADMDEAMANLSAACQSVGEYLIED